MNATTTAERGPAESVRARSMSKSPETPAPAVAPAVPLYGAERPVVQRRSACSCGGGCPRCQAKSAGYSISTPGDRYEVEADRVAEQVLRMPDGGADAPEVREPVGPAIQRLSHSSEGWLHRQEVVEDPIADGEQQDGTVQRKASGAGGGAGGVESGINSLRGGGRPLSETVRSYFEPRFGYDFGHVRVHTDGRAADLSTSIGALAFTTGRDIVFNSGQFAPESESGRRLLAHELVHVVQQSGTSGHTLMRTAICNCSTIGRDPTGPEIADASAKYPNLVTGDWCVTGNATPTYNCIAWTIGVTNRWVWDEVDSVYGDKDGKVSVSDFDAFYAAHGLTPAAAGGTPSNARVALFADGSGPTHGAVRSNHVCSGVRLFESKRGRNIRIAHVLPQLEGGIYGNVIKYYV